MASILHEALLNVAFSCLCYKTMSIFLGYSFIGFCRYTDTRIKSIIVKLVNHLAAPLLFFLPTRNTLLTNSILSIKMKYKISFMMSRLNRTWSNVKQLVSLQSCFTSAISHPVYCKNIQHTTYDIQYTVHNIDTRDTN